MYYAIIADIISSRTIKNRFEVQEHIKDVLHQINIDYADDICSNFTITLGDEFQGLLSSPSHLLEILDKLRCSLYPIQLRFGIGIGQILTTIQREVSIGADGPAFWYARKAIQSIHKHKKTLKMCFEVPVPYESLINDSLILCEEIEKRWMQSQTIFIHRLILNYGYKLDFTLKEIAEQETCSVQSIHKKLKATSYIPYITLRKEICTLLEM